MAEENHHQFAQVASCGCFIAPHQFLVSDRDLGMDDNFATIALLICSVCSQNWIQYSYEVEAFTASGRWYLGAITAEQAMRATAENAQGMLEGLSWYFYGGSYYGGQKGKASGGINLNP